MKASMSLIAEVIMSHVFKIIKDIAIESIAQQVIVRSNEQEFYCFLISGGYSDITF